MASFITDVLTRFPSRRLGHWEGRTDSQFCLCVCRTEAQGRRPGPGHPLPAAPRPAGARPRARPLSSCPAGAHSSWPQLPPSPQGAADVRWEAVDARRCGVACSRSSRLGAASCHQPRGSLRKTPLTRPLHQGHKFGSVEPGRRTFQDGAQPGPGDNPPLSAATTCHAAPSRPSPVAM